MVERKLFQNYVLDNYKKKTKKKYAMLKVNRCDDEIFYTYFLLLLTFFYYSSSSS